MTPDNPRRVSFVKRIHHWTVKMDVQVKTVTVRAMSKKWASCSTAGRLTFDAALITMPRSLQDYVIVHELLHLSVPNHGKLWKSLMRAYLGDYEKLEARLQAKLAKKQKAKKT